MLNIDRSQIQLQTISNLMTAGILKQDERGFYNELLSAMSWEDMLAALLESHQLRDDCFNPVNYYPIGNINLN